MKLGCSIYSVKMPNSFRAFSRFEMYMDDIAVISRSTTKIVLKDFQTLNWEDLKESLILSFHLLQFENFKAKGGVYKPITKHGE